MSVEPIRHEYHVRCTPDHAFESYAYGIGRWWPGTYSADAATFNDVHIEPRVGGAVIESHEGGETYRWGEVLVWAPGERLTYTSTLAQTRESPSEITVTFRPDDDGCLVVFEHGGWDEHNEPDRRKFGDWPLILSRFVDMAEDKASRSSGFSAC